MAIPRNLANFANRINTSGDTPAQGSNTQVQYNNNGVNAGTANFVYTGSSVNVRTGNVGSGSGEANLKVQTTDAAANDKGGRLAFYANITATDNWITGAISGRTAAIGNYSGYMTFETSTSAGVSAERMRITQTGEVLIGTTSTTANGGVLQISNGITFPATQSACSDVNTLDDYEEGTWTPSLGGTAVYNIQTGTYTKVGRVVYAYCAIRPTTLGTGSTSTISGLPFTVGNSNTGGSVGFFDNAASSGYCIGSKLSSTSITLYMRTTASTALDSSYGAVFGNNARVYLSVVYEI